MTGAAAEAETTEPLYNRSEDTGDCDPQRESNRAPVVTDQICEDTKSKILLDQATSF